MTNGDIHVVHAAPEQPSDLTREERLHRFARHLQERQAEDPMFLQRRFDATPHEWDGLPPAEREVIALVQQFLNPADIAERQRATQASVVIIGLLHEFETADTLEEQFHLPPAE
ncbi:MAG TPA: hypothetical protein VGE30_01760 [Candidatus Saccharimonadales bacterium]